ncbi:hypothetical protein K7X08_027125 [Anisodus acutangulus]|uniref:Carboxypeptidase A inhibitor-like domain-containing protein n=1 Tax=Anisodus acutangulus TaxID=402998 RepID=A0A9Q1MIE3_9SOLA|nr:hypothetical protein K7X08_027125 [Anisodus acutangulus]
MAKIAFFFGLLLVALAVHPLWSSNTQVMALRDLSLEMHDLEKIQFLLFDLGIKSCGSVCNTNEDCKPLNFCSVCKHSYSRGRLACLP